MAKTCHLTWLQTQSSYMIHFLRRKNPYATKFKERRSNCSVLAQYFQIHIWVCPSVELPKERFLCHLSD
jgi:hypothetical protein